MKSKILLTIILILSFILLLNNVNAIPDPLLYNIIGYYNGNLSGTNMFDSSVHGQTMTVSSVSSVSVGCKSISCLNATTSGGTLFYGSNGNRVPFLNTTSIQTNGFTINFFVNITSVDALDTMFQIYNNLNSRWIVITMTGTTGTLTEQYGSTYNITFPININKTDMITVIHNTTTLKLYQNGVLVGNITAPLWLNDDWRNVVFMQNSQTSTRAMNGYFDDLTIWDYSLNSSQVLTLNSTSFPYNSNTYAINVTTTPIDINSSAYNLSINATVNSTYNMSNIVKDSLYMYYSLATTLNNGCSIFYQNVCNQLNTTYNSLNMTLQSTSNNNKTYYSFLQDNDILPAFYPYNYVTMRNSFINNYTLYNNNNILFNVSNYSIVTTTGLFNSIEISGVPKSLLSQNILVYYTNSSYNPTSGGNPQTSTSAQFIGNIDYTTANIHCHNINWCDIVLTYATPTITKTVQSYILFINNAPNINNGWNIGYTTNASYNKASFRIGNYNSWTQTPFIFNIHLHQRLNTDSFKTYYIYSDGVQINKTVSSIFTDIYNINPTAPTLPYITTNCSIRATYNGSQTTQVNWTTSSDINADTINYQLRYYNPIQGEQNFSGCSLFTSTFCILDIDLLVNSGVRTNYNNQLRTYATDNTFSVYDTNQLCTINICTNNWTLNSGACVGGRQLVLYKDMNHCDTEYNKPLDDDYYIDCVDPVIIALQNLTLGGGSTVTDNLFSVFTFYDLIFIILIGITIVYPFYMNDKRYKWTFIFTALLLFGYSMFLHDRLVIAYPDWTMYAYAIMILLNVIASFMLIIGIANFSLRFIMGREDK